MPLCLVEVFNTAPRDSLLPENTPAVLCRPGLTGDLYPAPLQSLEGDPRGSQAHCQVLRVRVPPGRAAVL